MDHNGCRETTQHYGDAFITSSRGSASPTVNTNHPTQLLPFNPDGPDAYIDGGSNITEAILQNRGLDGIDLLISLTSALKARETL